MLSISRRLEAIIKRIKVEEFLKVNVHFFQHLVVFLITITDSNAKLGKSTLVFCLNEIYNTEGKNKNFINALFSS